MTKPPRRRTADKRFLSLSLEQVLKYGGAILAFLGSATVAIVVVTHWATSKYDAMNGSIIQQSTQIMDLGTDMKDVKSHLNDMDRALASISARLPIQKAER